MSAKHRMAGAALLVLCAGPLLHAQTPLVLPTVRDSSPVALTADAPTASILPSDAPAYPPTAAGGSCAAGGPNCCGPIGAHGPVGTDIYFRTGPSFIVSQTTFGKSLRTGYEFMGGGRTLLFNQSGSRACTFDLGVSYTYNDGRPESIFNFNGAPVTLRGLNRTAVSFAMGKEWYLLGAGSVDGHDGTTLSIGGDLGARWGTASLDMNIANTVNGYLQTRDVYAAGFTGLNLNLEVPMGAWAFLAGVRGEYSYTNMNLIRTAQCSLHDINVLLTVGVRY